MDVPRIEQIYRTQMSQMSQNIKTEKVIEIQLVRPTEVCGKVLSEKNGYKSVKTALLLSNVIDVDHQNSCSFTNKAIFRHLGVLAKFHEQYFTKSSN